MRLTVEAIRKLQLPADKSEIIYADDDIPGFGLRLRKSGYRGFVFHYRNRRISLGEATPATLPEARKTAAKFYARVQLGEDPALDKVEAQRQSSETVGPLIDRYLRELQKHYRPRSFVEIERHLRVKAKALHGMPLSVITRRDIAAVMDAVKENAGAVTANRVRSSLSGFFNWAVSHGLVEHNPTDGAPRNVEKSRDRVLTPSELRLVWNGLDDDQYGAIIKLLALTACRAAEIGDLRWSEISNGQILLPADRVKNKRAHIVPLSGAAAAIIEAQPQIAGQDTLFGSEYGFSNWAWCKDRLDAKIAAANGGKPIAAWTTHDLRRTAATMMAEAPDDGGLGIQPHVIEAILNHVGGHKAGVAGIYNRASYLRERKAALDLWADKLLATAEGRDSNVLPMPQRA
jgi:integrase